MKKKIWYTGNNVQFFDSEPQGSQGNVNSFDIDTDTGQITGLNVQQQSSSQRQPQTAS